MSERRPRSEHNNLPEIRGEEPNQLENKLLAIFESRVAEKMIQKMSSPRTNINF